ncbi:hypothetical protein GW819_01230 [Candidatus Gracilibacteria bacterium]|nr:hypothetical protein [Candidatus Gracilibacteria bacterium]OIO75993.1 MAG: hypothetical protein AUJ87_03735 [Candidatus Gracilibacteria bacterium CG1_02_38_174]PIQ12171.1 MAG: hypothetical protein COW68_00645 [Candidatus Gracilibacteria bacterium CG18_big_fil_WC_8_21_14_2_50_38_16]PIQ41482.1 MAG: hypothetical protein COW06_02780 [Candidatus Gracilibacteria bacterium CG12_big_fil_rev_8_21_14_0_65_38_15]PIZ01788.1 MAG: hypothetical protein COY60_01725 [Candidatus Gracilibacteria bacterium CG_4
MKKKIVSLLILGTYFFGGFGIVFGDTSIDYTINNNTIDLSNSNSAPASNSPIPNTYTPSLNQTTSDIVNNTVGTVAPITQYTPPTGIQPISNAPPSDTIHYYNNETTGNPTLDQWAKTNNIPLNTVTPDGKCGADCVQKLETAMNVQNTLNTTTGNSTSTAAEKSVDDPNSMTSPNFTLDPNSLSPSEKKYTGGTRANLKLLLANIGKYLLIGTTTIAVLSIVVGGLMISTTGTSDRAAKGKTIIMLNIMAVVVALFSYSIIRLVSWLIA